MRDLGLEGAKSVGSPGVRNTFEQIENDVPLSPDKLRPYRALVARANYLAADRPELQYSSKEVCRWMSSPTETSVQALKRLGRYVEGHRRLVYRYQWQCADMIDIYSDTDWAGCPRTRKSTSGGCLLLGSHLIKSWSSTQTAVSLSSGEAEFYGVVKASGIGLGYQALMDDLGHQVPLRVWTDSTATMGICARKGLGKLRHIDTNCLWIQAKVRSGEVQLRKVRGEVNPADLFTKPLTSSDRIRALLRLFSCEYVEGRSSLAPLLREGPGHDASAVLTVQQDWYTQNGFIEVDGVMYPKVYDDYGERWQPEAYLQEETALPHQYAELEKLFPRAVAVEEACESEDTAPCPLEVRGGRIGAGEARSRSEGEHSLQSIPRTAAEK